MPGVGAQLPPGIVDLAAAAILVAAIVRGLWIGLVREAFSLAALACAVFAVRRFAEPIAGDLAASYQLDPLLATAIAGAGVAVAAILLVAAVGFVIRRLIRASGLGLVDRVGGAVLGACEGALFVALILFGIITVTGRNDPLIAGTRSLAAFEALEGSFGPPPAAPAEER
ncbi:MAG: CvpA family protein [Deltaproteobacteria bacterium]|nr:CvpA family protein [Deltaproteobacteria bacterium]